MKLIQIVPLASLALVIGVSAVAVLSDPPLDFPFDEPPAGPPMPAVALTVGDQALTGRVLDGLGDPVDGAGVALKDAGRPHWTWTRADGSFTLHELEAGAHRVLVTAFGFESTGFDVDVVAGAAEPVTLTLDRPIGPPPTPPGLSLAGLAGTVDFGPLAQPLEGYEVLFLPTTAPTELDGGFPRRVAVEPDGSFEVPLLHEGEYRVVLLGPEDRGASGPDLMSGPEGEVRTHVHHADDEVGRLDLVARAGAVRGRALGPGARTTAAEPGPARPVRGALIRVERYADARDRDVDGAGAAGPPRERTVPVILDEFRATRTDSAGRYVVRDLPPGRYRVTLVAGRARRQADVVVPPREAMTVDFETTR